MTNNLPNSILNTAHALIAGATGCGKSVLIHRTICEALQQPTARGELYLIDLKRGVELCEYEKLPHVARFAIDVPQALEALDDAITIMTRRLDAMRAHGDKLYPGRDLWIITDELGFLLQSAKKQALPKLTQISQQGRAAKVHLILATQNPSRSAVPAPIQQNFTLKVALHCTTAIESRQVIGISGAEALPKHGTALVWSEGYVTREEVPMITDAEKEAAIRNSRGQMVLHLRAN